MNLIDRKTTICGDGMRIRAYLGSSFCLKGRGKPINNVALIEALR